jgi:D-alanine-D-alanine ligase
LDLALAISLRPAHAAPADREDLAELDGRDVLDAVSAALAPLGTLRVWDTTTMGPAEIARERPPDLIFNLAEGLAGSGREAQAPALFEWLQWRYLGSDPVTLAIAHDKWHTKRILAADGNATPAARLIQRPADAALVDLRFPVILKPVAEGSGKGIHEDDVVATAAELAEVAGRKLARYQQPVIIEEFLPGRELTAALIGNAGAWDVLPLVEVNFAALRAGRHRVYGYEAKWAEPTPDDLLCPAPLADALRKDVEALAMATCDALRVRDWARVDIRLDAAGRPHVLDVNPLPGIMPGVGDISCITRSAIAAGLTYEAMIRRLVDTARLRYDSASFLSYRAPRPA